MGPSGCGKTTLMRILLGLEGADEGRVEGVPLRKDKRRISRRQAMRECKRHPEPEAFVSDKGEAELRREMEAL